MSSDLGEKLQEAINNKKNDLSLFTWKLPKVKTGDTWTQDEIKLIDSTENQLKTFYEHCQSMLFNKNKDNLGRLILLKDIQKQKFKCGVELFLRYSESIGTTRIVILDSIRTAIKKNNVNTIDLKYMVLSDLINVPVEYRALPLEMVMDGCLDKLGKFYRNHITLSFILKQGLWFSKEEMKELTQLDSEGNEMNRVMVVKERLNLPSSIPIIFNPTGLTYTQFRAIITLRSKKYSEMTTEQLKVLRNRILYALEDSVTKHAQFWTEKLAEIEKVAASKNIILK